MLTSAVHDQTQNRTRSVERLMGDEAAPRGRKAGRGQPPSNSEMSQENTSKKTIAPRLDGEAQNHIGEKLKAMYDDVVNQPIPDRFRDLLDQLDKRRPPNKNGEFLN